MLVSHAVAHRTSVRAFRSDPVSAATVRRILDAASRAPSGGNLQPWRVIAVAGESLAHLKRAAVQRIAEGGDVPEYQVYPSDLWEPLRTRRYRCGEDLYATLGIPREDRPARLAQLAQNAELFGAPIGLFFCLDRRVGPPQWADLGMYMQTVMLLAHEQGLATCAQAFWARLHRVVGEVLGLPDDHMLFAGMALGFRDDAAPINQLQTRRDRLEQFAELVGF